ncbi:MAG: toll/interleukin-1 receptor domain-containing protein, partial [Candidatus Hodarchaeota archaeon]
MTLVRQLEEQLDNEGIKVIIAEDIREPGIDIEQKLRNKIRDCSMLIALLTENGVNSKWVAFETEYAKQINRHVIPFKEESVAVNSTIEWVPFSKYDPPQELLRKVIEAITKRTEQSPLAPILGLGILVFLLSLFARDEK